MARAAETAGMSRAEFLAELARRRVDVFVVDEQNLTPQFSGVQVPKCAFRRVGREDLARLRKALNSSGQQLPHAPSAPPRDSVTLALRTKCGYARPS